MVPMIKKSVKIEIHSILYPCDSTTYSINILIMSSRKGKRPSSIKNTRR